MKTLTAVGDFPVTEAPTLTVSGGRDGVHLILRDTYGENSRSVAAWFDPAELRDALGEATARPARLSEPAVAA